MKATVKQQMSESLPLGFLLMLAGGFLDAYSYLCRGEVFANAQTGNIVLLGISLAQGQWEKALQYFIPIGVFAFGILLAEKLRNSCQEKTNLHWRQVILLLEIVMLTLTVFLGSAWNWLANSIISFVCALQVESFRKIRGNAYASTMCTGNLRSAAEAMYPLRAYRRYSTAQEKPDVLLPGCRLYGGRADRRHLQQMAALLGCAGGFSALSPVLFHYVSGRRQYGIFVSQKVAKINKL